MYPRLQAPPHLPHRWEQTGPAVHRAEPGRNLKGTRKTKEQALTTQNCYFVENGSVLTL